MIYTDRDHIVQLSETVEFPEGYNAVLVEGYDDATAGREFPTPFPEVYLSASPTSVKADGKSRVSIRATVRDADGGVPTPRAIVDEQARASDPYTVSVRETIQSVTGIWMDADGNGTHGAAVSVLGFEGRELRLAGPIPWEEVVVSYVGGASVTFSLQSADQPVSSPSQGSLLARSGFGISGGDGYSSSGTADEDAGFSGTFDPSEALIVGGLATSGFIPSAGQGGKMNVVATYGKVSASVLLSAYSGRISDYGLSVSSAPAELNPGGQSAITAQLTNADGGPVLNASVSFSVYSGDGAISNSSGSTDSRTQEETAISLSKQHVVVSEPIAKIDQISVVGGGSIGVQSVKGTTILLSNKLSAENLPIFVRYRTGGKATAVFTAGAAGKAYVQAKSGGAQGMCAVTVLAVGAASGTSTFTPSQSQRTITEAGVLDPEGKHTLENGLSVDEMGVKVDSYGYTDDDPGLHPAVVAVPISNFGSGFGVFGGVGQVSVQGGTLVGQKYGEIYIGIPWKFEINAGAYTRVTITDRLSGKSIAGATVTVAGQTQTTDSQGQCVFKSLPEGTHPISISAPGYQQNQVDVKADGDLDTANDTITIAQAPSEKKYKILPTNFSLSLSAVG